MKNAFLLKGLAKHCVIGAGNMNLLTKASLNTTLATLDQDFIQIHIYAIDL